MKKSISVSVVSVLVVLLVLVVVYVAFKGFTSKNAIKTGSSSISTLNTAGKSTSSTGTSGTGTSSAGTNSVGVDITKQGTASSTPSDKPSQQGTVPLTKPSQGTVPLAKPPQQGTVPLTKPSQSTVPLAKPSQQGTVPLTKPSQGTVPLAKPSELIESRTKHLLVASSIHKNHKLPDYYITKKQARRLGWRSSKGNLCDVAPGKAIGGDRYADREHKLPKKFGRKWFEADVNYHCGHRGKARLIYSNDGLIYLTLDHYKTFTQIKSFL
ncbi:barnase [Xenorhabdus vietnamensis]|uniref:Ribonuclease n=1 Tax=Xenorhabdus vietnamensis TaxID=351656 RepID=A0A1Y2SHM4_9GAMM|nr:barnase [Xenorhabdus vietnamensis]